MYPLQFQLHKG